MIPAMRFAGRVVVVTGSSRNIGLTTARRFAPARHRGDQPLRAALDALRRHDRHRMARGGRGEPALDPSPLQGGPAASGRGRERLDHRHRRSVAVRAVRSSGPRIRLAGRTYGDAADDRIRARAPWRARRLRCSRLHQHRAHASRVVSRRATRRHPVGRRGCSSRSRSAAPGTTDELASAILFLVSDEASYIVGATIRVAGGWARSGALGLTASPQPHRRTPPFGS